MKENILYYIKVIAKVNNAYSLNEIYFSFLPINIQETCKQNNPIETVTDC